MDWVLYGCHTGLCVMRHRNKIISLDDDFVTSVLRGSPGLTRHKRSQGMGGRFLRHEEGLAGLRRAESPEPKGCFPFLCCVGPICQRRPSLPDTFP